MNYFKKMWPTKRARKQRDLKGALWSVIGAFICIVALSWIITHLGPSSHGFMLIGSLGASVILIFTRPTVSAAQPRNIIGGHMLSAICGITVVRFITPDLILASALAVCLALVVMEITDTKHPPGGSTALIAVLDYANISHLGYLYALAPVALSTLLIVIIGLLFNNIRGRYPAYWW